ncbi:hypothetical protein GDO86_007519 [Hymenochirus boettgeri]|uniref:Uncharacterized protein n=1 Tax=Hymenochirus boettgeri TaxID=247094 RepID=A0A8T2IZA8_9PIPI|nr:hypothetical protein GDO86_007519 [Hymenochirus boettgeri]
MRYSFFALMVNIIDIYNSPSLYHLLPTIKKTVSKQLLLLVTNTCSVEVAIRVPNLQITKRCVQQYSTQTTTSTLGVRREIIIAFWQQI